MFDVPLDGLGKGSVTGETRKKITSSRENTLALVLAKSLDLHRPKKDRPAWAWRQRDKLSTSWLLARPGADSTLSNAEFSEASANNLCLPSPACAGKLGEIIKGQKRWTCMGMLSKLPTYLEIIGDIAMTKLSMLLVASACGQVCHVSWKSSICSLA